MRPAAWCVGSILATVLAAAGAAAPPEARVVTAGAKLRLDLTFGGKAIPSPASTALSRHEGAVWIAPVLAWLEGDSREGLAVRAARWSGAAWELAETVSPRGPGSQLALAGAETADGSPLLVWSAFDGGDDEIVWSRRSLSGWSKPARLAPDDATPDILPALAASGRGAIAAWSRYDGNDYRVVVSRLEGDHWTAPATLGPKGSYNAALAAAPNGRAVLVFQTAAGWEGRELDRRGRPTGRRAAIAAPADADDRAAIETAGAKGFTVRWRESGATTSASWR